MATPARIPSVLPVFIARASFIAPSTEADSDFDHSVTVELGRFACQHQADAAVADALAHSACIAAKARRVAEKAAVIHGGEGAIRANEREALLLKHSGGLLT